MRTFSSGARRRVGIVGIVVLNFSKHDRDTLTLPVAVRAVDG